MTFKDQIAKDNQYVFANKDEFWEYHIVNGKKMLCQVDNNELIDREKRYQYRRSLYADGVSERTVDLCESRGFWPAARSRKSNNFR